MAVVERALHGPAQDLKVDWLGQVVSGAALHAERRGGGIVDCGEDEQRDVRLNLHHLRHQLDAAGVGQHHVQQHAGDLPPFQRLEGLGTSCRGDDLVAAAGEKALQRASDRIFVVHHKNGDGTISSGHVSSRQVAA